MIVDAVQLSASTYRLSHKTPSFRSSKRKGDSSDQQTAMPHESTTLPELAHPPPTEAMTHFPHRPKRRQHGSERQNRSKARTTAHIDAPNVPLPDPLDIDEAYHNLLGPALIPNPLTGLEAPNSQPDQPCPVLPLGPVTNAEHRLGDKCWSRMTTEEQAVAREDGPAWNRVWWTGWS